MSSQAPHSSQACAPTSTVSMLIGTRGSGKSTCFFNPTGLGARGAASTAKSATGLFCGHGRTATKRDADGNKSKGHIIYFSRNGTTYWFDGHLTTDEIPPTRKVGRQARASYFGMHCWSKPGDVGARTPPIWNFRLPDRRLAPRHQHGGPPQSRRELSRDLDGGQLRRFRLRAACRGAAFTT